MAHTELIDVRPRLLGIGASADYLGITRATMSQAIREGQVEWVLIGHRKKVSTAILDRMLQNGIHHLRQGHGGRPDSSEP